MLWLKLKKHLKTIWEISYIFFFQFGIAMMILVRNWLNFSVFYPHKVIKARNDDNQRRIYNAIGLKKKKKYRTGCCKCRTPPPPKKKKKKKVIENILISLEEFPN